MFDLYSKLGLAARDVNGNNADVLHLNVLPRRLDRTLTDRPSQPLTCVPDKLFGYWADCAEAKFARSTAKAIVTMGEASAAAYAQYMRKNNIQTTKRFFAPGTPVTHPPLQMEYDTGSTHTIRRVIIHVPHPEAYRRARGVLVQELQTY